MSTDEITTFLTECVEGAIGPVSVRKMFGGLGIWVEDAFIAMISDGTLSIRLDEDDEPELFEAGFVPNDPASAGKGRKRYYEVPADVIENSAELTRWLRRSMDVVAEDNA